MRTLERWACVGPALASGTKRRGRLGIAWAGVALLTATLWAALVGRSDLPLVRVSPPHPWSPTGADRRPSFASAIKAHAGQLLLAQALDRDDASKHLGAYAQQMRVVAGHRSSLSLYPLTEGDHR